MKFLDAITEALAIVQSGGRMRLVIVLPTAAAAVFYSALANAYSQEEVNIFAPPGNEVVEKPGVGSIKAVSAEMKTGAPTDGAMQTPHATAPGPNGTNQPAAPEIVK
ncbi:hypothetical protein [Caballeronia sp. GAWG1-1]|uniref:hypothetical protein n=1 Tax=Caballeronia sp. GAWG1-1 TaxID=2921742 RepID=UPI002027D866|nr:hypothetical protein [Caballeronia sp. GAWG1-1]